jgi:hypothetical protein
MIALFLICLFAALAPERAVAGIGHNTADGHGIAADTAPAGRLLTADTASGHHSIGAFCDTASWHCSVSAALAVQFAAHMHVSPAGHIGLVPPDCEEGILLISDPPPPRA